MFKNIVFITVVISFCMFPLNILAKINVVTTTKDLASIAHEVGKDKITVRSLATGNTDIHYAQARPDYILRLNRADVFIQVGLELEIGWVPLLLKQSRNAKIQKGAPGYCYAYRGVPILDRPMGEVNRQMGDLHPSGNPHYWPDPVNGIIIARNIKDTLKKVDPQNSKSYENNYEAFKRKMIIKIKELIRLMRKHKGKKVVVYHKEFTYVLKRYKLNRAISIEKLPGVSPSPSRIREVIGFIKQNGIKVVLVSPWSNIGSARRVAEKSGAQLIILPIQTGSTSGTETYIKMVDRVARLLDKSL